MLGMTNSFNPAFDYYKASFINDNSINAKLLSAIDNANRKWRTTFTFGMSGSLGETSLLSEVNN
jgi:hypothetical protein